MTGFGRFWTASTVTGFGAYAVTVAIGVLVVVGSGFRHANELPAV